MQMFPPHVPNTGNLFISLAEDNESQDPLLRRMYNEHESEEYLMGLLANGSDEVHNNVNDTVNERVGIHEVSSTSMGGRYRPTNETGGPSRLANSAPNGTNGRDRSAKRKRKSRGINKQNFAVDHPEKVCFNEVGQAVEPPDLVAKFVRFLGIIATDASYFPIDVFDFRELVKSGAVDKAWKTVKEALDWSDPQTVEREDEIKKTTLDKLNERWKKFKASLKDKYYNPNTEDEDRFHCPDDRVNNNQWRHLVEWWDGDGKQF
ncbi:uncharacterized protein Pyn_36416 [Prunus yedoensis var. nudiflora]|uniref:Uncharacterized protein n=1 Tax=Prunus yedoensis var. nudiflora TaxID=2094558 RepID=A0A314YD15_PRUYE|nr:uncharacterized protein Pyn_36416 [Prunus yedoensis var. nudiflora]